jgi:rare lipoprotein A
MRLRFCAPLLLLILAACSSAPKKETLPQTSVPSLPASSVETPSEKAAAENHNAKVCRQVMQHDESKYTAGGLYAPDIDDAHPDGELDISLLQEPVPRNDPKSKYGNKSPYTVLKKKYFVRDSADGYKERGIASWYGTKFHGRKTSSQEIYDMCQFSAAHKTLPIPSYVRVTRLDTGQSVIVRVNDRGPFHDGRIIDLSFAAASKLGINKTGTAKVEVEAISAGEPMPAVVQTVTTADESKNYLQVASFSSEDNAKNLKDRLQDADINQVFIQKQRLDGNPLWRVRIGPLGEVEMRSIQDKLQELGLKGLRVGAE